MKSKLATFHHFVVALILITKGFDKIQHHHNLIGWTILLMGLIILIYFIFTKISNKTHKVFNIVIHFFESLALFLTSYVYFQEGRTFLPYITLVAGLGFLLATFMHLKGGKTH